VPSHRRDTLAVFMAWEFLERLQQKRFYRYLEERTPEQLDEHYEALASLLQEVRRAHHAAGQAKDALLRATDYCNPGMRAKLKRVAERLDRIKYDLHGIDMELESEHTDLHRHQREKLGHAPDWHPGDTIPPELRQE
jgi:hypothetical protein